MRLIVAATPAQFVHCTICTRLLMVNPPKLLRGYVTREPVYICAPCKRAGR